MAAVWRWRTRRQQQRRMGQQRAARWRQTWRQYLLLVLLLMRAHPMRLHPHPQRQQQQQQQTLGPAAPCQQVVLLTWRRLRPLLVTPRLVTLPEPLVTPQLMVTPRPVTPRLMVTPPQMVTPPLALWLVVSLRSPWRSMAQQQQQLCRARRMACCWALSRRWRQRPLVVVLEGTWLGVVLAT
jgi:hypothetical protein